MAVFCVGWIAVHQKTDGVDAIGDARSDCMNYIHLIAKQTPGPIPLFRIVNDNEQAREYVTTTAASAIPFLRMRYAVVGHPECPDCRKVECAAAGPCDSCGRKLCKHEVA